MPTHSRTLTHTPWAPCGSPLWRRLVPAIRGALVMALVLCAVVHGVPQETHESVSAPAGLPAMAAGEDPHGPHAPHDPHGAADCAADVIVRTALQPVDELPLGAMAVVVLVAVSLAAGRTLIRQAHRRRRSARTGRVALVVTSRWRI
ncbi:hypothetical protein [Streptomyces sp. NPDC050164]|uniref:hypothetical protein n=1 Tax=Streptomyces sp. NPDC050164 TaxID=3365605 RepID=UPI0037A6F6D0